jgi:carbon-monoxide dehydrogenase large subunit
LGGDLALANEAYRAVFLRIHPTGKGVLSLTHGSDGNEGNYAQIVSNELGIPSLDVKVVPADTDRFGIGHGFNETPSGGTSVAVVNACGKIKAKAQLLAGMALGTSPQSLKWDNGAFGTGKGVKTIEDLALYAHGSGALPPGVEGGLDAQTVYSN